MNIEDVSQPPTAAPAPDDEALRAQIVHEMEEILARTTFNAVARDFILGSFRKALDAAAPLVPPPVSDAGADVAALHGALHRVTASLLSSMVVLTAELWVAIQRAKLEQ